MTFYKPFLMKITSRPNPYTKEVKLTPVLVYPSKCAEVVFDRRDIGSLERHMNDLFGVRRTDHSVEWRDIDPDTEYMIGILWEDHGDRRHPHTSHDLYFLRGGHDLQDPGPGHSSGMALPDASHARGGHERRLKGHRTGNPAAGRDLEVVLKNKDLFSDPIVSSLKRARGRHTL